jgi:peptidoglycan DL-endopeptidase CwlO
VSIGHTNRVQRSLKRGAVLGSAVLVGSLLLAPLPGSANPDHADATTNTSTDSLKDLTLSQAEAKVDQLNHEAEIASEQMNTIKVEMGATRDRLKALKADLKRQGAKVTELRSQLIGRAMSAYQNGGGLSTSTSFLVAKDPQTFLTGLANSAVVDNQQAGLLTELTQQQRQLTLQQQQIGAQLDSISKDKDELAKQQSTLEDKTHQVQEIVDGLQAAQQAKLEQYQSTGGSTTVSRSSTRVTVNDIPASERAQVAVSTALAQLGDPYVYGASGPDAFDCSGLTMYSWRAAGVSLPHSSSSQTGYGTPVSLSDLSPGDLIFYYSPISHVAMYIGHGQIVHAPHTGTVVSVTSMYEMPIAMAVHIA